MNDKKKTDILRSCCDIDVVIDQEAGKVTTEVKFKPEFIDMNDNRSLQSRRFYCRDIVKELARQGFIVDNPIHIGYIDNHHGKHSISYELNIPAPKVEKKPAPAKKASAKKKAAPKKD